MMARTPRHDPAFRQRPDAHQIVLPAREDVFAVGGEGDAGEGAVVGGVEVREGFGEVVY